MSTEPRDAGEWLAELERSVFSGPSVLYDPLDVVDAFSTSSGTPLWLLLDSRFRTRELVAERGTLIWLLVQLSGLTIPQVADHLGFDQSTISRRFVAVRLRATNEAEYREVLGDEEAKVRRVLHG